MPSPLCFNCAEREVGSGTVPGVPCRNRPTPRPAGGASHQPSSRSPSSVGTLTSVKPAAAAASGVERVPPSVYWNARWCMTKNRQTHRYAKPLSSSTAEATNRQRTARLRVFADTDVSPGTGGIANASFIAETLPGDGYDPITAAVGYRAALRLAPRARPESLINRAGHPRLKSGSKLKAWVAGLNPATGL